MSWPTRHSRSPGRGRRRRPIALVFLVFLATLPVVPVRSQEPPTSDLVRSEADLTSGLDPEVVSAIDTLIETAAKTRRRQAEIEMKDLVRELGETHRLDETSAATLETAAGEAVTDSLPLWKADLRHFLALQMTRMSALFAFNPAAMLNQLAPAQAESIATRFQGIETTRPRSQPAWTEALARVIPETAVAEWRREIAESRTEREAAIDTFLEDVIRTIRESHDPHTDQLAEEVIRITTPGEETAGKIRNLAKEIAAGTLASWSAETRFVLERSLDDRWAGFAQSNAPIEAERSPDWKTGLATLLTPEQLTAWEREISRKEKEETAAFLALLDRSGTNQRVSYEKEMKKEREALAETVAPDPAVMEKLVAASREAISESLEARRATALEVFRALPRLQREAALASSRFNHGLANESESPIRQPAWTGALDELLTPAQLATWQAEKSRRAEEDARRIADMIDATAESYEMQFQAGLDPSLADIVTSLELDEERAEAFRTAGKAAVRQSIESWKNRARDWLDGLTPEQRENYTEQGRIPLGSQAEDAAERQPAWTGAFETILTDEERNRWEEIRETRTRHREEAVSSLMLSLIEEWVGFDEAQWTELTPICRRGSGSLVNQLDEQHFYMNLTQIAQALRGLENRKVREVLDPSQWDRWERAVALLESRNRSRRLEAGDPGDLPPGPDPVAIENAITGLLYQRNLEKKREVMLMVEAEIEVGGRATSLAPDTLEQLQTAAKGAAEEVVHQWDTHFSSYVRDRVKAANPRTIDQMLASIGNYNSGNRDAPLETAIWKRSLGRLLDEAQAATWKQASDARIQRRRDAVAAMVTVFFEGRLGLNGDQLPGFREKLRASLETYGPDIERYFTSWNSPWYLQYYSIGLPVMGIPEKELKAMLSREQFQIWEQQFQGNAANYWENIERYHEQRKEEKQGNES